MSGAKPASTAPSTLMLAARQYTGLIWQMDSEETMDYEFYGGRTLSSIVETGNTLVSSCSDVYRYHTLHR